MYSKIMKQFKVFISHASAAAHEKEFARQIAQIILMGGEAAWFDENHLSLGDDINVEIQSGIAQSENFILLWSKDAKASPFVESEWRYALEIHKQIQYPKILVVRLDETEVPQELAKIKWLEWNQADFTGSFLKLIGFLNASNITNIQSRISAMYPWINYNAAQHNVLDMRLNSMFLLISTFRMLLDKYIANSRDFELADTLSKFLDTETFSQFRVSVFFPIFPLGGGRYELIYSNRMRVAPKIRIGYVPSNLKFQIIRVNEVSAIFEFINSDGVIHQGIVPFSFQIELDAEL